MNIIEGKVFLMAERDRTEERRPLREAFVDDLYRIMEQKVVSQRRLALHLGLPSHTTLNRWRHCISEPDPEIVFEIEEFLGVPPGGLSRNLGYLPVTAWKTSTHVNLEKAIAADAVLPDWGKELLVTAYAQIMRSLGRGRRR